MSIHTGLSYSRTIEAFIPIRKEYTVNVYREIPVRVLGGTDNVSAFASNVESFLEKF